GEAVRGPEGLDQADVARELGRRSRHPGEDRRRQAAADQELRLRRGQRDRRAQLRRFDLCARGRQGLMLTVELNQTLAELVAKLCVELGTDDPADVLSRALGLLEMVQLTKRRGGRLCFVNERGEQADIAV